ncbi:MAG: 4-hydroxy-tetrahydrodipicolinate synthase [Oscillospiraceae bacterium]|nr:4-hydroxy-tetrahydrodipicolinate synthase [Oscillospiraceae bacterium]
MKKVIFNGSGVAVATPMNGDFSINYTKLGELIDRQIEHGTDAIVICGTTGESTTMTDDEHVQCIRFAVEYVKGRVPVIAGAGSNDTAYAVWLSKEAKAIGADAQLQVTPYYNKTSQLGLVRHFTAIADATDLPVILYNVPSRTGVDIKTETYLELSRHPNIVATKEANGDMSAAVRTAGLCGDNLAMYSGEDMLVVPMMSIGGRGVISTTANIMPKEMRDMCALYFEGKAAKAGAMQRKLAVMIDAMFCDVNPMPLKYALNRIGMNAGPCRMPLVEPGDNAKAQIDAALKHYNLI